MRALSRCIGQGCTPSTIQLVFSASGNQQLQLTGVDGEIVADETRITWNSSDAAQGYTDASDNQVVNVVGKFATVNLSTGEVEQIVEAASVRGQIGGQSLKLGSGVRTGLESLMQKMEGVSNESENAGGQ